MKFQIQTKNEDGSVAGDFTLNKTEATFVLNVGLNYLAAAGAMPDFVGESDAEIIAESTGTIQ